ncbi:hypothetical protein JVU11DRAFT_11066 [Chiua virens]|nr:hypothetical protein JVU11DRAFT_11066 [Chiua virens]
MAPPPWMTAEQNEFLESYYQEYLESQAKREYSSFWPRFYDAWFQKYPEEAMLFPEWTKGATLSTEQKQEVEKAEGVRKSQLCNRARNKWGAGKKNRQAKHADIKSCAALISDLMKARDPRSRKPQKIEVYLNLYYEERVKPLLKLEDGCDVPKDEAIAAASEGHKGANVTPKVSAIMRAAQDAYKKESEEIKAKVETRWQEIVEQRDDEPESKGGRQKPEYYIGRVAPTLGHFLKGLQELTGWSFSVLMGGPSPEASGRVEAYSVHVGTTQLGNTFDQAHPNFAETFMQPYKSFLDRVSASLPEISLSEIKEDDHSDLEGASQTAGASESGTIEEGPVSEASVPQPTQPQLLQMTKPTDLMKDTWPDLRLNGLLGPNEVTNNALDFSYDFGNPAAISQLDDFLAKYGDSLTVFATPSTSQPTPVSGTASESGVLPSLNPPVVLAQPVLQSQSPLVGPTPPPASVQGQPSQPVLPSPSAQIDQPQPIVYNQPTTIVQPNPPIFQPIGQSLPMAHSLMPPPLVGPAPLPASAQGQPSQPVLPSTQSDPPQPIVYNQLTTVMQPNPPIQPASMVTLPMAHNPPTTQSVPVQSILPTVQPSTAVAQPQLIPSVISNGPDTPQSVLHLPAGEDGSMQGPATHPTVPQPETATVDNPPKTKGKRSRQPSKRNDVSNSIGADVPAIKKRAAPAKSGNVTKCVA